LKPRRFLPTCAARNMKLSPEQSLAGTFQFTDPQATNYTERFYRVTSP
jgi:hypothetical protein